MINNEKCLLMFPPKATSVRIASGTKRVYFRAILTCKDSLTSVVINSGLESVECSFSSTCDKLEEIIIPNSVIENIRKYFQNTMWPILRISKEMLYLQKLYLKVLS